MSTTWTPCMCEGLRRASRAVTRAYDEALRPAGMRITQFSIVAHVALSGECRLRDIGASLEMDETTVNRSIRILEREGWVEIRTGEDRRERLVSITTEGKRVLQKATSRWRAAQERLKSELGESTWEAMAEMLPAVASASSA